MIQLQQAVNFPGYFGTNNGEQIGAKAGGNGAGVPDFAYVDNLATGLPADCLLYRAVLDYCVWINGGTFATLLNFTSVLRINGYPVCAVPGVQGVRPPGFGSTTVLEVLASWDFNEPLPLDKGDTIGFWIGGNVSAQAAWNLNLLGFLGAQTFIPVTNIPSPTSKAMLHVGFDERY